MDEFAQFTQYIDPASEPGVIGLDKDSATFPLVSVGPTPFEVRSVSDDADGSTTVATCQSYRPEVFEVDGSPRPSVLTVDILVEISVSPVTAREAAELAEQGLEAPELPVRGDQPMYNLPDCEATGAVVQAFVSWRDVAPIGRYRER